MLIEKIENPNIPVPREEIEAFCRRHHIRKLSLFGSVLREDFGPESDVDVLVEFEEEQHTGFAIITMQDELSEIFGGRPVDLVTLKALHPRIRELVLKNPEKAMKDSWIYMIHMLETAREIQELAGSKNRADLDENRTFELSFVHLIQVIGEAARQVPDDFRENFPEIAWKKIVGMRHRIVHDYLHVDRDVVWDTVTDDIPELINQLERAIPPDKL